MAWLLHAASAAGCLLPCLLLLVCHVCHKCVFCRPEVPICQLCLLYYWPNNKNDQRSAIGNQQKNSILILFYFTSRNSILMITSPGKILWTKSFIFFQVLAKKCGYFCFFLLIYKRFEVFRKKVPAMCNRQSENHRSDSWMNAFA